MYFKLTEKGFVARAQCFPSQQLATSSDPNTKQVMYVSSVCYTNGTGVRYNNYTRSVVACA